MTKARLAYGDGYITVSIPDGMNVRVVEPTFVPALPDPMGAVRDSLRHPTASPPLREMVRPTDTVAVVFSDITRPTPNHQIVPAVLAELREAGVPRQNVTLFNSTGTHRLNTAGELEAMLGKEIAASYRIVQNDARARGAHESIGVTRSGNGVRILKDFLDCSFKILTGFIEPHFFAGFSGGGKAVMPGLAHIDTIMRNHSARNIDDPHAQWAILENNPLRAEIDEAAAMARPDFLVNVALNRDKRITRSFAGEWRAAYEEGARFVKQSAMQKVESPFDIVLTSNSGYPLDLNLYQSVKGMSAAARITRPGGTIVMAAECREGIPDHGSFGRLLRETPRADALLARIRAHGSAIDDQWQAQILALIASRVDVFLHTGGLTDAQVEQAMLRPCASIDEQLRALSGKYGTAATVCVLPEGPQTVPYL